MNKLMQPSSMREWWEEAVQQLRQQLGWQLGYSCIAAAVAVLALWRLVPITVLGGWWLVTIGISYLQQLWLEHPDSPMHPGTELHRPWVFQWLILIALQGTAWGLAATLLISGEGLQVAPPEWLQQLLILALLVLTLPTALWLSKLFPPTLIYLLCALLLPALWLHFSGLQGPLPFLISVSCLLLLAYSVLQSFRLLATTARQQEFRLEQAHQRESQAMQEKQTAEEQTMTMASLLYQDALTHIANRRHFDDFLEREWRRGVRSASTLSLLMLDIDFFKSYNDQFGHPAGDRCLQRVAGILDGLLKRPGDLVARYGGEEFAVILAETDAHSARALAEQMRHAVVSAGIDHPHSRAANTVSISLGVATMEPNREHAMGTLIQQADQALYQAKAAGRNQLVVYVETPDPERYPE